MAFKVIPEESATFTAEEIKRSIALSMVKKYRQEQYRTLVNNGYTTQTRSVYFTINALQGFLEKLEDKGADGCRIYFATVSDAAIQAYPGQDRNTLGQMTVVLVATKTNAATNMHQELLNNGDSILLPALDFGTLCPPGGCQAILMSPGNSLDFDAN
ncbi:MAG: hypothetical protein IM638_10370 [Bacteroidetes bacterium]|nr:hypothetical protein [Bacteroidota bacterium]